MTQPPADAHQALQALRASEAKFAGILAIAADAIVTTDAAQRIVHYNHGAEQIFGWTADEVIGQPLDVLLPERARAGHRQHVERFGAGPDVARRMGHRREVSGLRKSGAEFPAEASISRLDTPEGRLYTVVLRDITERKREERTERLLAEAGAQLSRSLDLDDTLRTVVRLPVPVLADCCFVELTDGDSGGAPRRAASVHEDPAVNDALRGLERAGLPATLPSIPSLDIGSAVVGDGADGGPLAAHHADAPQLAAASALGVRSAIVAPLAARGRALGTLTLVRLGDGRAFDADDLALAAALALRAALAVDNAYLFEAARRATHSRDEVLSVVSHDLRNPVSAVTMCARVLLDDPPDDAAARRELLEAISESAEWMQRMIQDLVDVASIEARRLSVHRRAERVPEIVRTATSMVELSATARAIALTTEVAAGCPPVFADAERVVQVLTNLLGNALKFTPEGGDVAVRAVHRDGEVVLSVTDTGPGIPPDDLPHIFDRYWHARRTARTRGSGLGLAIVRGIVEAHGGRVWAESAVGQGSAFFFTLPAATDAGAG